MYDSDLSFIWYTPTRVVFGANAVNDAGQELDALGASRALLVTDRDLAAGPLVARVAKALGKRLAGVFGDVVGDSAVEVVEEGAARGRAVGADSVVSVGGGSAMDSAKMIAVLLTEGGALRDYQGFQMLRRPLIPHLAVPTTAGTGSEVTYVAVIRDAAAERKLLFGDYHLVPRTAILDPTLTTGLPARLTGGTGMDAACHAVEALHSLQREPIADAMALHALRLIREHLPTAVSEPLDLRARGQMLIAACLAGSAFGNAQVGVVHALAHTVGARYRVHHGTANAILLPHCILYNADTCGDRYRLVAEALGAEVRGLSDEAASRAAAEAVWELTRKVGMPQRLRDVGVPREGLARCAEEALSDGSIVYNPKPVFDPGETLGILEAAW
jgi:alcohol dehydrogenase class IV